MRVDSRVGCRWQHRVAISRTELAMIAAYFFGGVFLANFTPHFIAGVSGRPFHTPFATPPFRGLSSPLVNILWSLFNLAVAYLLLVVVGGLELHRVTDFGIAATGFGL